MQHREHLSRCEAGRHAGCLDISMHPGTCPQGLVRGRTWLGHSTSASSASTSPITPTK